MSGESFDELNTARATRAGAWILLFVGVFGAGFGIWRWHSTVVDAFAPKPSTFKSLDQIEEDRLAGMKAKDTDLDTLSDYDEAYVYHTSAYLKDSDSDGLDDKSELVQGKNPNCPEGKDCGPLGTVVTTTVSATASEEFSAEQKAVEALLNPTPDQVRKFLLDSGVKQEEIDKIDDATLMEMYRQSLKEAQQ